MKQQKLPLRIVVRRARREIMILQSFIGRCSTFSIGLLRCCILCVLCVLCGSFSSLKAVQAQAKAQGRKCMSQTHRHRSEECFNRKERRERRGSRKEQRGLTLAAGSLLRPGKLAHTIPCCLS